ncbi:MAG: GNAT family N-acetyltransferase [Christensenellales bacterium]|jgi:ribosomal protein S18 acetylase RimI-like enzyme
MEIKRLRESEYGGMPFTMQYTTNGYYDVICEEDGFRIEYKKLETPERVTYTDSLFAEWIDGAIDFGAFDGEKLLGFVEGMHEKWNNRLRICNLCVLEEAEKGSGVGTALMQAILAEGRRLGARMAVLETQNRNENAIAFYRKLGFRLIGLDMYCYSNEDPERHDVRLEMGMPL